MRANANLAPYVGKTTPLDSGDGVKFDLPYIDRAAKNLGSVPCILFGDTLTVGAHKYRMDLPAGATPKSIKIEGAAATGSATLTAEIFYAPINRTIKIGDLLGHIEHLRAENPQTYQMAIENDTVTFNRLA